MDNGAVRFVATQTNCRFMDIFKPVDKIVLELLLWPHGEYSLLLLKSRLIQLLTDFLAGLAIEWLALAIFQRDLCYPSSIFA